MLAQFRQVIVDQAVTLQYLGDGPLPERIGVQVKDLFVECEPLDHWFSRGQPGYSQAWG